MQSIPHILECSSKFKEEGSMYSRLVIEGNAVYEIDEDCAREKQVPRGFGNKRREPGRVNPPGRSGREQGR